MQYNKIIGIDISKDKFDISVVDGENGKKLTSIEYANTSNSIKKFIKEHCTGSMLVVMESTGNYHLKLLCALVENGIACSVVNPLVIKRFGDMKLHHVKNDSSDASLIAQFGYDLKPPLYKPISASQQKMKSLITTIDNLIKQRTQLKNLLHSQELIPIKNKSSLNSIKSVISHINNQLEKLEKELEELIKSNYPDESKLINSVKGIGKKTSSALISYLGDMKQFNNHKQLAAYVGINPCPRQSGSSLNRTGGISKKGNGRLRTLLYLSALSASRCNRMCKELYERLTANGKKKKTALIAVANKLLKQIFAVVRDRIEFDNDYSFCPKS